MNEPFGPPGWNDFKEMMMTGVFATIIALVVVIIAAIINAHY